MTPERVVALIVALAPVITIFAGIAIALIQRHEKRTKTEPQPAVGVTVDDDHADEAIAAWKERAIGAEQRAGRAEQRVERLEEELETVRLTLIARTRELAAARTKEKP